VTKLLIDLQSGFTDDTVLIRVNGEEKFHIDKVTTDKMMGLATSLELPLKEGPTVVDIDVRTRDLKDNIEIIIKESCYLGISIQSNKIEFIISKDPFGYF